MANLSNFNGSDAEEGLSDEDFIKNIIFPPTYIWVLILGLNSLIFFGGLMGNFTLIVCVFKNREFWTPTNIFLGNLAVADALVIFLCLPPTVAWDITETWFLGTTWCKTIPYFQFVSFSVSIMTLTWISGERWYAICHPFNCLRTKDWAKRRAIIAIAAIWIISFVISTPNLIYLESRPHHVIPEKLVYLTQCRPRWNDHNLDVMVTYLKFGIFYALPLVVMAFAYYQMFPKLWYRLCLNFISTNSRPNLAEASSVHNGNDPAIATAGPENGNRTNTPPGIHVPHSNRGNAMQLRLSREKAKMLGFVVIAFATLHFPVHLVSILSYATQMSRNGLKAGTLISHLLCYLNSAINPVICYKIMNVRFRREFRRGIAYFVRCRWFSECFSSWFGGSVRGESIPLTTVVPILPPLAADTTSPLVITRPSTIGVELGSAPGPGHPRRTREMYRALCRL